MPPLHSVGWRHGPLIFTDAVFWGFSEQDRYIDIWAFKQLSRAESLGTAFFAKVDPIFRFGQWTVEASSASKRKKCDFITFIKSKTEYWLCSTVTTCSNRLKFSIICRQMRSTVLSQVAVRVPMLVRTKRQCVSGSGDNACEGQEISKFTRSKHGRL